MTTGLYKKGMVLAIICLFVGAGIVPSIGGNLDVIFSDNFNDNSKDFSKWTEIYTDGIWEEINQITEFQLYEPGSGVHREGIESKSFMVFLSTTQNSIITWDLITAINTTSSVGSIFFEVTSGTNWIRAMWHRASQRFEYRDSNDVSATVLGLWGEDNSSCELQIYINRYKLKMRDFDSGWINDTIFPSNPSLSLKLWINTGGSTPSLYMREGFDNVVVKGYPPNDPPFADFTWSPSNPAPNMLVTLDGSDSVDPDGTITLYEWDWDDDDVYDTSSSDPTATHEWSTAGDYPVTLRVTDDYYTTDTKTQTVHVENYPPGVAISSPKENETVNLTILVKGVASDLNGNETVNHVEVKIDSNDWKIVTGTTAWTYSWDTTEVDNGPHTIYARSYDGDIYSVNCSIHVIVNNVFSEVVIDKINGGFRANAEIKNIGTGSASDVDWFIDLEGGLILAGGYSNGTISELGAGESITVRLSSLFGLLETTITVTAGDSEKQATGFMLGPLVLNVQEI